MTTGSTTTPRAAAPQVPRFVKKLGAIGLLAGSLLFVRPSEMPGTHGRTGTQVAMGSSRIDGPTFTVATLVAREPVAGPPLAARPHAAREHEPSTDVERGRPL
jgi:hypothetical protein